MSFNIFNIFSMQGAFNQSNYNNNRNLNNNTSNLHQNNYNNTSNANSNYNNTSNLHQNNYNNTSNANSNYNNTSNLHQNNYNSPSNTNQNNYNHQIGYRNSLNSNQSTNTHNNISNNTNNQTSFQHLHEEKKTKKTSGIQSFSNNHTDNMMNAEEDFSDPTLRIVFAILYFIGAAALFFLIMFMDVNKNDKKETILYFSEKLVFTIGFISILLFMKTRLEGLMLFSLFFLLTLFFENQYAILKKEGSMFLFHPSTFLPLVAAHILFSIINIFSVWLYENNFIILPVIIGFIFFFISLICIKAFSPNSPTV